MPSTLQLNDIGYDILLVIGQSNAAGYNTTKDLKLDFADPRIEAWGTTAGNYIDQKFVAIDPDSATGAGTGISFSIPFARWYASAIANNRKVLIINAAVGGAQLVDSAWDTPSGAFYLNAVARSNAAIANLPNTRLTTILWLQGETDAVSKIPNQRYVERLDLLVAALRNNIVGAATAPFLVASMLDIWRSQPELASNGVTTVNDVEEIHHAHVTLPYRVLGTAYVEGATGIAARSADAIHYSAFGQRENGKRLFFQALPAALANVAGSLVAPAAPLMLMASAGAAAQTINLTWPEVAQAGLYEIDYKPGTSTQWQAAVRRSRSNAQIGGLSNGVSYNFRVRAINHAGASAYVLASATAVGPVTSDTAWSRIQASQVNLDAANTVQTALDTSGHGRHWQQTLASGRMALGTWNTLPVLKMTPATSLQTTLPSAAGSYTKMCLVRHDAVTAAGVSNYLSGYQTNDNCHLFWRINTTVLQAAHNTIDSNLNGNLQMVAQKWYLLALTYDATNGTMRAYMNGILVGTATVPAKPLSAVFWLGGISATPAGGATADCLEAATWDTALDANAIVAERNTLAQRYGLTLN